MQESLINKQDRGKRRDEMEKHCGIIVMRYARQFKIYKEFLKFNSPLYEEIGVTAGRLEEQLNVFERNVGNILF